MLGHACLPYYKFSKHYIVMMLQRFCYIALTILLQRPEICIYDSDVTLRNCGVPTKYQFSCKWQWTIQIHHTPWIHTGISITFLSVLPLELKMKCMQTHKTNTWVRAVWFWASVSFFKIKEGFLSHRFYAGIQHTFTKEILCTTGRWLFPFVHTSLWYVEVLRT